MLVLTRKSNQSIMIGDEIEVSVLSVMGDKVRIGIQAPRVVPVFRREVYLEIQREESEASELAETFKTTRGNVSHCVSSLEAKGLLLRKIDPEDARAYQLTLKPQGKKCAVRVIGVFDKLQREFEREIGKTALVEMLKNLRRLEALSR